MTEIVIKKPMAECFLKICRSIFLIGIIIDIIVTVVFLAVKKLEYVFVVNLGFIVILGMTIIPTLLYMLLSKTIITVNKTFIMKDNKKSVKTYPIESIVYYYYKYDMFSGYFNKIEVYKNQKCILMFSVKERDAEKIKELIGKPPENTKKAKNTF